MIDIGHQFISDAEKTYAILKMERFSDDSSYGYQCEVVREIDETVE